MDYLLKEGIIQYPLPFWDERPQNIDSLVLHCSAHNALEMLAVLAEKKLSAHYIIDENGDIWQLVPEEKRAWHAGVSFWRGRENLNHYSIGIELCSSSMGQKPYSAKQLDALLKLCHDIMKRHPAIVPQNIVAHSDIAPSRKPDPGVSFPWQWLAKNGIGLWYNLGDSNKIKEKNVAKLLMQIGYNTEDLAAASYAFCRHFYPQAIQIITDNNMLVEQVYPHNFTLPESALPVLRAVAYCYR